jgi:hypothetical protein
LNISCGTATDILEYWGFTVLLSENLCKGTDDIRLNKRISKFIFTIANGPVGVDGYSSNKNPLSFRY